MVYRRLILLICLILLSQLTITSVSYLNTNKSGFRRPLLKYFAPQSSAIKITGSDKDPSPVVNENSQTTLLVTDSNGQTITSDLLFESDNQDIATVDPKTGVVRGVQQGFVVITVRRGNDKASISITV